MVSKSINFDKIPNATGWNAAPNHDSLHPILQMDADAQCCSSLLTSINTDDDLNQKLQVWMQVLCNLAYLSFFSLVPFTKNGFLTATVPLWPFLVMLQWTVDGSTFLMIIKR